MKRSVYPIAVDILGRCIASALLIVRGLTNLEPLESVVDVPGEDVFCVHEALNI